MSTNLIKRAFYIPQAYTFESGYRNPGIVVSLAPVISSSKYVGGLRPYYQQEKFFLTSTASLSVGIHTINDDSFSETDLSLDKVELISIFSIFKIIFLIYLVQRKIFGQFNRT
jgi:hypothetical protein